MGPTNVALVKLFEADQLLRQAQSKLDAVTRDVRIQERRVNDLAAKLQADQARLKTLQASYNNLDLDLRTRDAHIEKLRNAQQAAKNNREYQSILIEINTQKVDRAKIEEQALRLLGQTEKLDGEIKDMTALLDAETAKLQAARDSIESRVAELQVGIDQLKPARDAAAAEVPGKALTTFERMCERYEGEAMAPMTKPDRRHEEYMCSACNMDLVPDLYNRLHVRDELVFCPSCQRLLYIPDDLPPSAAVNQAGVKKSTASKPRVRRKTKAEKAAEASASTPPVLSKWDDMVTRAQGESVRAAVEADHAPVPCVVHINGELVGEFKGKTVEHLERCIRFVLSEKGFDAVDLAVSPRAADAESADAAPSQPQDAAAS